MSHELASERLVLRRFVAADWPDLYAYIRLPEHMRFEPEYPAGEAGARQLCEFFAGNEDFWAITLAGRVIGHLFFGLQEPAEFRVWSIGFVLNPAYGGHGYATEACLRVLDYGFKEIGVRRVEAGCSPENPSSWRLLERIGMVREAHHRQKGVIRRDPDGSPIFWDCYEYGMLRDDWEARKQTGPLP